MFIQLPSPGWLGLHHKEKYFEKQKFDPQTLSYSHRLELIKLPNDKDKIKIAGNCIQEKMPSRKLRAVVSKALEKLKGEPVLLPLRIIRGVSSYFDESKLQKLIDAPEKLERMRPRSRVEMRNQATSLLEKMETWKDGCNKLISALDEIDERKQKEKEEKKRKKAERKAKGREGEERGKELDFT